MVDTRADVTRQQQVSTSVADHTFGTMLRREGNNHQGLPKRDRGDVDVRALDRVESIIESQASQLTPSDSTLFSPRA